MKSIVICIFFFSNFILFISTTKVVKRNHKYDSSLLSSKHFFHKDQATTLNKLEGQFNSKLKDNEVIIEIAADKGRGERFQIEGKVHLEKGLITITHSIEHPFEDKTGFMKKVMTKTQDNKIGFDLRFMKNCETKPLNKEKFGSNKALLVVETADGYPNEDFLVLMQLKKDANGNEVDLSKEMGGLKEECQNKKKLVKTLVDSLSKALNEIESINIKASKGKPGIAAEDVELYTRKTGCSPSNRLNPSDPKVIELKKEVKSAREQLFKHAPSLKNIILEIIGAGNGAKREEFIKKIKM